MNVTRQLIALFLLVITNAAFAGYTGFYVRCILKNINKNVKPPQFQSEGYLPTIEKNLHVELMNTVKDEKCHLNMALRGSKKIYTIPYNFFADRVKSERYRTFIIEHDEYGFETIKRTVSLLEGDVSGLHRTKYILNDIAKEFIQEYALLIDFWTKNEYEFIASKLVEGGESFELKCADKHFKQSDKTSNEKIIELIKKSY